MKVISDPFKNESCSRLDGVTIQVSPLSTVNLRPKVWMQVTIEIILQDRWQRNDRDTVWTTKASVTPSNKLEGKGVIHLA